MNQRAYRLPLTIKPISYQIELDLDFVQTEFPGQVNIQLHIATPIQQVELHGHELKIETAQFSMMGKSPLQAQVQINRERQTMIVTPKDSSFLHGEIQLQIRYRGRMNPGMHGLYLANDHHEKALCSQCQATSAREIFPCFDEPEFKATLQWTLHTPKNVVALTNGALLRTEENETKKTWYFAKTRSISSYLAAVVVGDFESYEPIHVHGIPLSVFALRGKKAQTEFALACTKKLLPFFENYFGIDYPYQKYDQVAVPGFDASAMENIGLVLFRQNVLLMDPKTTSWRQEKRMALVIAHEFAHMWFGNWVTMKWWDDLWLNEAFAEWMSHKAMDTLEPGYQVWEDFQESRNHAMKDDGLPTTHAIWTPVETPEEAVEMFDSITYEKGCAVMRMLEIFLGEQAFRQGLRSYMKAFAESNATGADLWQKLAASSGQDVHGLMQSWISQPGFPLVQISSHPSDSKTLTLKQHRFFESALDQTDQELAVWNIPMVFKYRDDRGIQEYRYLFSKREESIQLPARGTVTCCYANAKQVGFYRLQMNESLTKPLLQEGLTFLEASEQVGMIEDAWALVNSGKSTIAKFFDVLLAFAKSSEQNVVRALSERLYAMDLILEDTGQVEIQDKFRAWVKEKFLPQWQALSWIIQPKESAGQIELRAALLSMLTYIARAPEVIQEAKTWAEKERLDVSSVNPNLAGTLVGIAAYFGDEALYKKFIDTYLSRKQSGASPHETLRYLHAFSLFRSPELVRRSLDLIGDGTVPQESIRTILIQLMSHRHSQPACWEYLKQSWENLKDRVGDFGLSRIMESLGGFHPKYRKEIVDFFAVHPPVRAERAFARGLKRMDQYEELYHRLAPQLIAWFS